MDTAALTTFVDVARAGNFAAVARAQGLAPSSVSRVIALLEDEIGIRLFHRTTRRLSLTEAGAAYLDRVVPVLEELQRAGDVARDLSATPRGRLRVAMAGAFASLHFGAWLIDFAGRYPDVDVELVLDARPTDLVRERIDVAVRVGRLEQTTAVAVRLCAMDRRVVASPGYMAERALARPEDIADCACLLFPHAGADQVWRFRDCEQRLTEVAVRGRFAVPDGLILRQLACADLGLALLPRWMCARELATGRLIDVFPDHEVTATEYDAAIWLMYP
ncbi:MAG: LysR family transcriptional regulator, partial [Myxococcota bacterium]